MPSPLQETFNNIEQELQSYFIERDEIIHGILNAWLSGANILLLGPPGVAKTQLLKASSQHITKTKFFPWLLHKFSTPEELLGPFSMNAIENDSYRRITTNKLPEADTCFLDEIFKSNSGLLNTLLSIFNERIFYDDGQEKLLKLLFIAAASNEIPDADDDLAALYDRLHLKYMTKPIVEESGFLRMLASEEDYTPQTRISLPELLVARSQVKKINVPEAAREVLLKIRKACLKESLVITDRTYKFAIKLLKAEAWRSARDTVTEEDFEILAASFWHDPSNQKLAERIILDIISPELNKIKELYEASKEIVEDIRNTGTSVAKSQKCLEASQKLKDATEKMREYLKTMISKGKDTTKAKELIHNTWKMHEEVVQTITGKPLENLEDL